MRTASGSGVQVLPIGIAEFGPKCIELTSVEEFECFVSAEPETGAARSLPVEFTQGLQSAFPRSTWRGHKILTEEELKGIEFPYPIEPD